MKKLTKEQVLRMHSVLIAKTGGTDGMRDAGLLDAALATPFQTFDGEDLYPTITEKAVAFGFELIRNHAMHYIGKSVKPDHVKIYLSGRAQPMEGDDWDESKILQIGVDGSFSVIGDYKYAFGDASTVVDAGNLFYVGTNNMVTVVNLETGEKEFYTNKTQEDIDEMLKHK